MFPVLMVEWMYVLAGCQRQQRQVTIAAFLVEEIALLYTSKYNEKASTADSKMIGGGGGS